MFGNNNFIIILVSFPILRWLPYSRLLVGKSRGTTILQPSWETKSALHALLSNINDGSYLLRGPHMQNSCLRIPQPICTIVCLFEHVLVYSWHFSSGSQRWAQHVLAYHGIHHDQTICLWLTRPLTAAAKGSRGSDSTLNWRVYTDVGTQ